MDSVKENRIHQIWCSDKERNLLEFIRELGFGEFKVKAQDGEPITIVEGFGMRRL